MGESIEADAVGSNLRQIFTERSGQSYPELIEGQDNALKVRDDKQGGLFDLDLAPPVVAVAHDFIPGEAGRARGDFMCALRCSAS
jgi:hypothetical protein